MQFRRRPLPDPRPGPEPQDKHGGDDASLDDLARYEEERDDDVAVDYQRRALMNVIAIIVLVTLVGFGVWIADTIAVMEIDQDCMMQGRTNCAPVELPEPAQQ